MCPVAIGHCVNDFDVKAPPDAKFAENGDIPCSLASESVFVPDQQLPHAEPPPQNRIDELRRRERRQRRRKRDDGKVIETARRNDLEFLMMGGKKLWR